VIPGETDLNNAITNLEKAPEITDVEASYPEEDEYWHQGYIEWGYEDSSDLAGASTFSNSLVIADIVLGLYEDLKMYEIIDKYGEPSHVWIIDCTTDIGPKRCYVYLIYIEDGLSLILSSIKVSKNDSSLNITETIDIMQIRFFPPGMDGFCSTLSDCQHELLLWKGFGAYPVKFYIIQSAD
jgi:hypothetical protein